MDIDIKKIKSIIHIISKSDINEIKIQKGDTIIHIIKNFFKKKNHYVKKSFFSKKIHSNVNYSNKFYKKNKKQYLTIKSPMIGTFYRSPHPDKKPFVEIGDFIKIGTKICVIESMKLFNNIESDIEGKLIQVLVENETPVDYDQPLFFLEPNG
ncbi:acetyl-CoA carboxylase biotin carboxyl carrier protein [Blattabacterium cuenoti]|uniref:acetyl-CoA carboxylase biotin carboxyl carrier protein n=1 Tax=Blattabacterium cuenoti TaxID=1653831 RepID=UPI00293BE7C6|nr:acetyl-CoA carboxylase biotin carboxyl carrier protein [Blattabacterium cuenoti]